MARRQKRYHYIYKVTNVLNGKYYVGMHSTDDLEDGYLGSGHKLANAKRYYGKQNFKKEILEYLPNRNSLINREKELVTEEFLKDSMCMNLNLGGVGGGPGPNKEIRNLSHIAFQKKLKISPKFLKKMQLLCIKNLAKHSFSNDLKNRCNWKGRHHTEETKQKIRKARLRYFNVGIA